MFLRVGDYAQAPLPFSRSLQISLMRYLELLSPLRPPLNAGTHITNLFRLVILRRVTSYYSSRTDLSLRCFRIVLFLRHSLLQRSQQHVRENEREANAGETEGAWMQAADYRTRGSDTVAWEAEETAAALTLNNYGVCLVTTGEARRAVQALATSSTLTT